MTEPLRLAGLAARQLRQAELNEHWAYMESLLKLLQEMGARVIRLPDPRYRWRNDYMVEFSQANALPGTIK